MVTASQLQILQSPFAGLISTISTAVNVKLDDSNYLNWHFQMQLLLESNGIIGFMDGSHSCQWQLHDQFHSNTWIIDTGATDHMICSLSLFPNINWLMCLQKLWVFLCSLL